VYLQGNAGEALITVDALINPSHLTTTNNAYESYYPTLEGISKK
jgi:hypothetical protein